MANNPMTRKEFYLAKMAGEDVSVPEPMTREETYLKKIAEGGSGGGGGSNVLVVTADMSTRTLDKTWKEINDAEFAVIKYGASGTVGLMYILNTENSDNTYKVNAFIPEYDNDTVTFSGAVFSTNSETGYPAM